METTTGDAPGLETTYGTDDQKRLQAVSDAWAEAAATTPGAVVVGRMRGTDDPDALGWDVIADALAEDGAFGFRMIPVDAVDSIREHLQMFEARLDTWQVFRGDVASVKAATGNTRRPDGLIDLAIDDPVSPETQAFQGAMAACGVVPFSGRMLTGAFGPVANVALAHDATRVIATAHAYMPHNQASQWRGHAWGGLVSVVEDERGRGLGRLVNAMMAARAVEMPGVTHLYELATKTNEASQRMIESCGLTLDPDYVCAFAVRGGGRFTR